MAYDLMFTSIVTLVLACTISESSIKLQIYNYNPVRRMR